MERRGFLKALIEGVAVAAAVRTFPFRVFSFPTDIKIPTKEETFAVIQEWRDYSHISWVSNTGFKVGDIINVSGTSGENGRYQITGSYSGMQEISRIFEKSLKGN